MVFSSVLTSSPGVSAVDMGGTMDNGNNMPPPEDAPATTDALTAGGGSDNDDDEDDNDDNSGGSQDDDNDNDKDKDNDNGKNDEPIPKDAPATSDALTAKKLECPPGQEVTLFSTTCEPAGGGSDSTQGTTSAATVCPTSPTPTSYDVSRGLSVMNAVWGITDNHQIKTEERDTQETLLHRIVTPERPGVTEENPALLALCTRQPVEVTDPDGTATTYDPDGTVTVKKPDGTETTHNPDRTKNIKKLDANGVATVDRYDADNKLTSSDIIDPDSGRKVKETKYIPGTGARTSETTFNLANGRPLQTTEYSPMGTRTSETTFNPGNGKPAIKKQFDPDGRLTDWTANFPGTDKLQKQFKIEISGSDSRYTFIEHTGDGRIVQEYTGRLDNEGGTGEIYGNGVKKIYDKDGELVSESRVGEKTFVGNMGRFFLPK